MIDDNKISTYLFCILMLISTNCLCSGDEKEEKIWRYQSLTAEEIVFRSNVNVSMTRYDSITEGIKCFKYDSFLCIETSTFDFVIPQNISQKWETDYSRFKLLKDDNVIKLLGQREIKYISVESIKNETKCKNCGSVFFYSYKYGLIGFMIRYNNNKEVIYLSDSRCNLGGSCIDEN